ncbi:hypothetical protein ACLOJK_035177, partial [Asimina triloba]
MWTASARTYPDPVTSLCCPEDDRRDAPKSTCEMLLRNVPDAHEPRVNHLLLASTVVRLIQAGHLSYPCCPSSMPLLDHVSATACTCIHRCPDATTCTARPPSHISPRLLDASNARHQCPMPMSVTRWHVGMGVARPHRPTATIDVEGVSYAAAAATVPAPPPAT